MKTWTEATSPWQSPAPRSVALAMILLALAYTCLRFWPAFQPGWALTNEGDGLGTIGAIAHFKAAFETRGWAGLLVTEQFPVLTMDGGQLTEHLATLPWKVLYLVASLLPHADDAYDILAAAASFLTLVVGYRVARVWGGGLMLAIVSALLFANLDNFNIRIGGHLGLSFYFVSIAQLGMAHVFVRDPSPRHGYLLGAVSALAFAQNEYFGYFGGIFTAAYIVGDTLFAAEGPRRKAAMMAGPLARAAALFLLLMVVLYPVMLLGRIYPSLFANSQLLEHAHPRSDFTVFGVPNPVGLFAPTFSKSNWWGAGNPGEFTFRIGLLLPLSVIAMATYIRVVARATEWPRVRRNLTALAIPSILMAMFALPESSAFSLAKLTYAITPIFRVGARAYLLVDLAAILAFVTCAAAVLSIVRESSPLARWSKRLAFLVLAAIVFLDVSSARPLAIAARELPQGRPALEALRYAPQGLLLEVPALPMSAPPEAGYIYLYDFAFHRKPVANLIVRPRLSDPDMALRIGRSVARINNPRERDLRDLGRAGVRYVVVDLSRTEVQPYASSASLEQLYTDGQLAVFRTRNFDPAGNFWRDFVLGTPVHVAWSGCGQVYEKNGIEERACPARFTIGLKNFERTPVSGLVTCDVEAPGRLVLSGPGSAEVSHAGRGLLAIPFAMGAFAVQNVDARVSNGEGPVIIRKCMLSAPSEVTEPPTREKQKT